MKRLRLTGWTVLLVAGGALAGCYKNHHQGPHYSGWGGCYSHGDGCSHMETVQGSAHGSPMESPDTGGHPVWTQPSGGGLR